MSKNFFKLIKTDLFAAKTRDPAARSYMEIILTYSGFHALFIHRLCHLLWKLKLKLLARFIANLSRIITSIEIHPAVEIDQGFFIDHGSGLVIGETTTIGKDVTVYQQVTLGGLSPSIDSFSQRNVKRHPTIGDNVIIGSGAQVLGPILVGKNSRVGTNAVVLKNVPENFTYVGIPARRVESETIKDETFEAYGISGGKIDDPNKKSILALFNEIHILSEKINKLKSKVSNFPLSDKKINLGKKEKQKYKGKIEK